MDNGAHWGNPNQGTSAGTGAHVTPQERAAAVAKLQTFLMAVVGPGEDALLKAAELANKFEHHVFASTTNKEEYLRVIVTRMQQVQQRRKSLSTPSSFPADPLHQPPTTSCGGGGHQSMPANGGTTNSAAGMAGNALRLSDTEKASIRQKVAKMVSLLPKLDLLLNDSTRRPPLTSQVHRQLQTIKAMVERQVFFLEANTFILSTETSTSMLDQLQGILRQQRMLEDIPEKDKAPTLSGGTEEQRLLVWLRNSRPYLHRDTLVPSKTKTASSVSPGRARLYAIPLWREQEGRPSREQLDHTQSMLLKEITWLTQHLEGLRIIMQSEPWGYDLLIALNSRQRGLVQLSVQLPPSYPSDRLYLRSVLGVDSIVHEINQGYLRLFPPISLTTVVRIVRYALGDGENGNI